jgi:geranylgeranyl pyrophosphate synthase
LPAPRGAQYALRNGLLIAASGQHLDLASAGGDPLRVEDCLEIARGKAGALVAAACVAGASFGTDHETLLLRFHEFGVSSGIAGQLNNDMHDVELRAGKTDVVRLKQTVPIAFARRFDPTCSLEEAVSMAGIPMTYALLQAERVRATEALDAVISDCPHPTLARRVLAPIAGETPATSDSLVLASVS